MSPLRTWTESQLNQLKELVLSQTYTYSEIAKILGRSRSECQQRGQYMGLKNPTYQIRQTKHAHLRKDLLHYYLTHSAEECQKKFNLTQSEFKSCLTYAYMDPKLAHIRKETRRRDVWSVEEIRFLLRHAGIQPRDWISRKLNRGGVHSVKESLSRLNLKSKHLNGMPKEWATILFGERFLIHAFKTKAGPAGRNQTFCFRMIPWVKLEELIRDQTVPVDIQLAIQAMAKFQRWIFGTKDTEKIVSEIQGGLYA